MCPYFLYLVWCFIFPCLNIVMLAQVLGCISCSSRSHQPNQSASVGHHCNRLGSRTEHAHWMERRRRNGWREREKESHGTEMLQLWEQRLLHLKTCYWRHRWSVRGCFQWLLGRTATAREQLCDKVKRVKHCLLWWLMIKHYVTLINCNSACRLGHLFNGWILSFAGIQTAWRCTPSIPF